MILQSLKKLYDRLAEEGKVPPFGFAFKRIDFEILLDRNGNLISIEAIPESNKMKVVPDIGKKRSSDITPYFMWDNTSYVFGYGGKHPHKKFEEFKKVHHQWGDNLDDEAMQALLKFLDKWDPDKTEQVVSRWVKWEDLNGKNLVFRFPNELRYFHERQKIREKAVERYIALQDSGVSGICLVTGEKSPIAKLHPVIKKYEASFVNFNADAFKFFGKEQSLNAPVSVKAAFEYTAALNFLLSDDRYNASIDPNTTFVFWTERDSPTSTDLLKMIINPHFKPKSKTNNPNDVQKLKDFFNALASGKKPTEINQDEGLKFYILGLVKTSKGRVAVSLWYVSTVGKIWENLSNHYNHIKIEGKNYTPPSVREILNELIPKDKNGKKDKSQKVPSTLAGALMYAILSGTRYPESLLALILQRLRIANEADPYHDFVRAAMIKGILIRNHKKEVKMSLDPQNTQVPYLLGRLFAVLEAAQENARKAENEIKSRTEKKKSISPMRERYFGAAAATPRRVFPLLLSLTQHHIAKDNRGRYYDKLTGEIIDMLPAQQFPAHLRLEDQGLFALGYYHQRNAIHHGKNEKTEEKSEE